MSAMLQVCESDFLMITENWIFAVLKLYSARREMLIQ